MEYDQTQARRAAARFLVQDAFDKDRFSRAICICNAATSAGLFTGEERRAIRSVIHARALRWTPEMLTYVAPGCVGQAVIV